ncbi:hypothetical protein PIB30_061982 [Stylosanthes scabra]|uniref:GTD-binding domain-containing protein n=1 Tax=Stylosanthes scabra TaxID=79078 RepID=A0ABU6ULW5_9FABA|nr:hypothetical protein [Stylosanthes scabra]
MAANKFATMLHRNTNKIVVILVYALLEWILIVLLLLNSLFSYLISRFAKSVGLQPPCLWCSRVDHILQHGKTGNLDKDLVCESHAAEISGLGYCSNHKKLAETQHMCEDCLASRPNRHENSFGIGHNRIAFISWISHENGDDDDDDDDPSWGDARKGSFIVESIHDEKEADKDIEFEINHVLEEEEDHEDVHQILSDIESFILREVAEDRSSSVSNLHSDEKEGEKDDLIIITELDPNGSINYWEDRSIEVINIHSKNNVECDTNRLIPVEFIDSVTSLPFEPCKIDELERFDTTEPILENSIVLEFEELKQDPVAKVHQEKIFTFEEARTSPNEDNIVEAVSEEQNNTRVDLPISQEPLCSYESSHEDESSMDDESSTSDDDDDDGNAFDKFIAQNNLSKSQILSNGDNDIEDDMEEHHNIPTDNLPPSEEQEFSCQCIAEDESSESADDTGVANAFDEFISQNNLCSDKGEKDDDYAEMIENDDGVANTFDKFISQNNLCLDKEAAKDNDYAENEIIEKPNSAEKNHEETSHQSCEADEDKLPETPSSVDGLQYAHRKFMQRESGAEDSIDGSVASELEYGDPTSTIDKLKTALKSERNALSAIYQELEEERSASAVAANQTMAMITRLQEEKAAMRMEALQYQRMMEEQAEYDQEALQLLNELMLKREKEKQELEKELEEYRQKVMDFEAKEKLRLLRRMKDGTTRSKDSSSSDISIDLNRDEGEDNLKNKEAAADDVSNLEEMALDCVKHINVLDDSLAEFEEERASILGQLRELEEKIMNLEESEEFNDDIEITEHSSTHCEKELNENYSSPEENMHKFSDDKQDFERRTMGSLAKRLLPYLDAAENEDGDEAYTLELDHREVMEGDESVEKVSVEEEVDRVYERLQALETDREFLQQCVGSIQNGGEKGTDLLQEILQHLRDLKAVEQRLKSLGTDPLM